MSDRQPPEGFVLVTDTGGFLTANGPFYRREIDGRADLGFWVEDQHLNEGGTCHGGWLSTFADIQLAGVIFFASKAMRSEQRRTVPTMNLSVDFLSPARSGAWVEGRAEVLRLGGKTAFAQMTATADGVPCLRASGIFKY